MRFCSSLAACFLVGSLFACGSASSGAASIAGAGGTSSAGGASAAGGASGASGSGTGGDGTGGGVGGTGGSPMAGGSGGSGPSDLEVVPAMFTTEGQPTAPIVDGGPIPLVYPVQGGHVLMVGARMRNLHTNTIKIRGRLRDPVTGDIAGEDTRTVVVEPVEGDPTQVQTNIQTNSQVANIPACPNYTSRSLAGAEAWTIEITVTELYVDVPRTVTATRTAVPTCGTGPDAALCLCECAANYVLGNCPVPNGGLT